MSTVFKVVIIGSGPAGYAAGTYASRAQLSPLMFAGEASGGQLTLTTVVENYPGFPEGVTGPDLVNKMREQAKKFGVEIIDKNVTDVDFTKRPFKITVGEETYQAESVIIATGAAAIPLGVTGERDYIGRGVSYCAVCDAPFYRGKKVFVIGGGDAAMEDTLALTKFAREITIVHRRDSFKASKIMQQRVLEEHKDKVQVLWNSMVTEVKGNNTQVTGIQVKNTETGKIGDLTAEGVFVAIGHKPASTFLTDKIALDEKGYIKTAMTYPKDVPSEYPSMTSVPGVFAAGDNVDFRYRQAATAAGYGVMAALDVGWWLERA